MKTPLNILLCLLVPISFAAADELISIDATGGLITVQQKGALKSYRLKPFTDVLINGQKGSAAQLKAGMDVTITLADPQTASKVTARGNLGAAATPMPAQPQATPSTFFADRANAQLVRKLVIKASIDGDDKLAIQDGKVRIHHGGWQKPKDITINGVPWKTQWTDNDSDDFTALKLAPFAGASVAFKKVKGRGEVTLIEPPTEANSQKLVIHFKDEKSGAGDYEIRIEW
jgi:hypothetical protein